MSVFKIIRHKSINMQYSKFGYLFQIYNKIPHGILQHIYSTLYKNMKMQMLSAL